MSSKVLDLIAVDKFKVTIAFNKNEIQKYLPLGNNQWIDINDKYNRLVVTYMYSGKYKETFRLSILDVEINGINVRNYLVEAQINIVKDLVMSHLKENYHY